MLFSKLDNLIIHLINEGGVWTKIMRRKKEEVTMKVRWIKQEARYETWFEINIKESKCRMLSTCK